MLTVGNCFIKNAFLEWGIIALAMGNNSFSIGSLVGSDSFIEEHGPVKFTQKLVKCTKIMDVTPRAILTHISSQSIWNVFFANAKTFK